MAIDLKWIDGIPMIEMLCQSFPASGRLLLPTCVSDHLEAMPLDGSSAGVLSLGGLRVPYSAVSLVTLTVQNSALAILLHYVRASLQAIKATLSRLTSLARRPMPSRTLQLQRSC